MTTARLFATILALLAAVLVPATATAQDEVERAAQEWIARFEQSYGSEGLYVLELNPRDPAGPSRLNLQLINAAAMQFRRENPDARISYSGLNMRGLIPDLREAPEDEEYIWDEELGMFTSSLGGARTPEAGVLLLLEGYEAVRARMLEPDNFVRTRWRRLYEDEDLPGFLRREILLREFLISNYDFPEVRRATEVHRTLREIDSAIEAYAITENLTEDDEVTLQELASAGLLLPSLRVPEGVEVRVGRIGDGARATLGAHEITGSRDSVHQVRLRHAAEIFSENPSYPPALALAARFQEPERAVAMLNRAIEFWPDVPGLRVERLSHYARMRNFGEWQEDLDFVLSRFPAAPLLVEIEVAAEQGRVSRVPEFQARLATLLADRRPDLLPHQLYAYTVLRDVGEEEVARTIRDRLVFANPAWRLVLPPPGEPEEAGEAEDPA